MNIDFPKISAQLVKVYQTTQHDVRLDLLLTRTMCVLVKEFEIKQEFDCNDIQEDIDYLVKNPDKWIENGT